MLAATVVDRIGGVLVGAFKLHVTIVIAVLGFAVAILSWTIGLSLEGWAGFVLAFVISGVAVSVATIAVAFAAQISNDMPFPIYIGIGAAAAALMILLAALLSMLFRKFN